MPASSPTLAVLKLTGKCRYHTVGYQFIWKMSHILFSHEISRTGFPEQLPVDVGPIVPRRTSRCSVK